MGLFNRKDEKKIDALGTIQENTTIKLVRRIAEGGMGAVYEAVQIGAEGFEKRMAVKTILEDMSANQEFVEMFIGEAKLVADLIHQHIVQIYQLGKIGKQYYMAMEYIHGVNLEQFIDRHHQHRKRIPTDICVYIISRVARALGYAHKKRNRDGDLLGVVHRDISPKNVMIEAGGVVKLTDFGIAKARNLMRDREGDVLMGKVQYMSPEQAAFEQTDGRSDVFSLGVVLYELLAGRNIFADDDTLVCIENVQKKPIPPISHYNPNVDEDLQRVIDRMLERDKNLRYQDADECGADLEYYIYKGGVGPTFNTMQDYLLALFPELKPVSKSTSKLPLK